MPSSRSSGRMSSSTSRVDTVLVVQVDVVGAKTFQGEPSTAAFTLAAVLSVTPGAGLSPAWETSPNLVATTAWSRRLLMALPTTSSLWKGP